MSPESAWEILGVQRSASTDEIKRAYRALLKKHKPETDPEGFRRLRAAFEEALANVAPDVVAANQAAYFGDDLAAHIERAEDPAPRFPNLSVPGNLAVEANQATPEFARADAALEVLRMGFDDDPSSVTLDQLALLAAHPDPWIQLAAAKEYLQRKHGQSAMQIAARLCSVTAWHPLDIDALSYSLSNLGLMFFAHNEPGLGKDFERLLSTFESEQRLPADSERILLGELAELHADMPGGVLATFAQHLLENRQLTFSKDDPDSYALDFAKEIIAQPNLRNALVGPIAVWPKRTVSQSSASADDTASVRPFLIGGIVLVQLMLLMARNCSSPTRYVDARPTLSTRGYVAERTSLAMLMSRQAGWCEREQPICIAEDGCWRLRRPDCEVGSDILRTISNTSPDCARALHLLQTNMYLRPSDLGDSRQEPNLERVQSLLDRVQWYQFIQAQYRLRCSENAPR